MLYFSKNTQNLIVPKFRPEAPTHLVLINQVTKVETRFVVSDTTVFSPTHYTFDSSAIKTEGEKPLVLDDLENGQYNYIVYYNSVNLASGIIQLGDYTPVHNQYNSDLEIKQYNG